VLQAAHGPPRRSSTRQRPVWCRRPSVPAASSRPTRCSACLAARPGILGQIGAGILVATVGAGLRPQSGRRRRIGVDATLWAGAVWVIVSTAALLTVPGIRTIRRRDAPRDHPLDLDGEVTQRQPRRFRRRWVVVGVGMQPLVAFMNGAMMGAAQQHQVAQIGAAMQPMPQMMRLAAGRWAVTAREAAAAVADRQRGALRDRDHPGGAAHLQRLGGGTAKRRRQQHHRRVEAGRQVAGHTGGWWRVTSTRVTAASQASRLTVWVGSGPTQPPSPRRLRLAQQAGQVDGDGELGADPAGAREPAALQRPAGQLNQRVGAPLRPAAVILGACWSGQGFQRRQQGLTRLRLQQPVDGDHPGQGRR
jgi:hypothetical protein